MSKSRNSKNRGEASLLIVDPLSMNCENLSRFFHAVPDMGLVSTVNLSQHLPRMIQHARPDIVILGTGFRGVSSREMVQIIRDEIDARPPAILLLDRWFRVSMLEFSLRAKLDGYWSRQDTMQQLAEAVVELQLGRESHSPMAYRLMKPTPSGFEVDIPDDHVSFERLTKRERQIAILMAQGVSLDGCAEQLQLSTSMLDNYRTRIFKKLGVSRAVELVILAFRHGVVD